MRAIRLPAGSLLCVLARSHVIVCATDNRTDEQTTPSRGAARCLLVARIALHPAEADELLPCIKSQWRTQEAHVVFLKDWGKDPWIGGTIARKRPKFLVKLMAAAGSVHDNDLAWLVGDIQECVRNLRRKIGKSAFVAIEQSLANPNFEPPLDHMNRLLLAIKLTPASGLVLSILADAEGPLPPNEIADRLIISRATVTGLVDSLERRGYVVRRPHHSDRRMILVEITAKGRQVADAFRPIVHQHQKEWFQTLNEREQQQFIDALHRLQAALTDSN